MKMKNNIFNYKPLITKPSSFEHTFYYGPVGTGMSTFLFFLSYNKSLLIIRIKYYRLYNLCKIIKYKIQK